MPCRAAVGEVFARDEALWISPLDDAVESLSIQLGCLGAASGLEVVRKAGAGDVAVLAEWAGNGHAAVDARVFVLQEVVNTPNKARDRT